MKTSSSLRRACGIAWLPLILVGLSACDHHRHHDDQNFGPLLPALPKLSTVGSTTDATGGGLNPYGLDIARRSVGLIEEGDLIVCNFNDGATNTQGQGNTIIALHPNVGASPILIAQSPQLLGCSALAALRDGNLVAAASQANALQLVSSSGAITTPYQADTFHNPWSVAFADSPHGPQLYVSNASLGTIDRITLDSADDSQTGFAEIATGFTASGVPGTILAPAGLTYDDFLDTLYVVDSATNSVVALSHVSDIGPDGIAVTVAGGADQFGGMFATSARVIASGPPLNGPISSALVPTSGNLIVGNTLDAAGTNLLLEIDPQHGIVATRNVDTGAGGAIFGIVVGFDNSGNPVIFFNDDNDSTVKALSF